MYHGGTPCLLVAHDSWSRDWVFNRMVSAGYVPASWKHEELILFIKGGNKDPISSSYWPLTLLPVIGKVFEKVLYLHSRLTTDQLLMDSQYGFWLGMNMEDVILKVMNIAFYSALM